MVHLREEQEIFDIAYKGLESQNFEQCLDGSDCQYRSGERRCAIGWLISDENYHPDLEGFGAMESWVRKAALIDPNVSDGFLNELQEVHDRVPGLFSNLDMKNGLLDFANEHNLKVPS